MQLVVKVAEDASVYARGMELTFAARRPCPAFDILDVQFGLVTPEGQLRKPRA